MSIKAELSPSTNESEMPPTTASVPVKTEKVRTEEMDQSTWSRGVLSPEPSVPTTVYQSSQSQYIAFSSGGPIQIQPEVMQSVPSVAMFNAPTSHPLQSIMYCGRGMGNGPQQYYMPVNDMIAAGTTGDMSAYQLRNPSSSLPQGVTINAAHSSQQPVEDASRKRELRLMKNRLAAKACRQKSKEYVGRLQARVIALEQENQKLKQELHLRDMHGVKSEQDFIHRV